MTLGRLWYLFQRERRRGLHAAWAANVTLPKITRWRTDSCWPCGEVPVVTLTGAEDWLLCAWMLASWHHATQRRWRVIVMEDGTLPASAKSALQAMFSDIHFVGPDLGTSHLSAYPACEHYRRSHPLARKIFDLSVAVEGATRCFLFDSDVLFFRPPERLLAWADSRSTACWFNRDAAEGSLVTASEARDALGIELWPRVNSGLVALTPSIIDLDFCERALRDTRLLEGHIWRVEQTLFALCASRHGEGGLLPEEYEVSLGKWKKPNAVARHYVGAVRDRFHGEGVRSLSPILRLAPR